MEYGVFDVNEKSRNKNKSCKNEKAKAVMCGMTKLNRIGNKYIKGSLGVTNSIERESID